MIYEHAAVMLVSTIDQMITSGFNATLEECGGEFNLPPPDAAFRLNWGGVAGVYTQRKHPDMLGLSGCHSV